MMEQSAQAPDSSSIPSADRLAHAVWTAPEARRIAAPLAGARGGPSGVLALAVVGVVLWPATVATSATAGRPLGHRTATMAVAVEQAVLGNSEPDSGLLLARGWWPPRA